jgi:hypothetical protein
MLDVPASPEACRFIERQLTTCFLRSLLGQEHRRVPVWARYLVTTIVPLIAGWIVQMKS